MRLCLNYGIRTDLIFGIRDTMRVYAFGLAERSAALDDIVLLSIAHFPHASIPALSFAFFF